jgi:hypothetical protein
MSKKMLWALASLCAPLIFVASAVPSHAQTTDVKEKPPMYAYIANWDIPREHWADMLKSESANNGILEKALADGTILAYGTDENLVHQATDNFTHDDWWAASSLAGVLKVLDQFSASSTATSSTLATATKHWDEVIVSHYYNWHPGAFKNAYTRVASYKVKADAPDDAVDTISKTFVVPLLEKMLADGTILEYEVDELAVHSVAPGTFSIVYVAPKAEGLDQVQKAIAENLKVQALAGPAFGAMTDQSAHRDELLKSTGTFK